jgi:hypothetical protein
VELPTWHMGPNDENGSTAVQSDMLIKDLEKYIRLALTKISKSKGLAHDTL